MSERSPIADIAVQNVVTGSRVCSPDQFLVSLLPHVSGPFCVCMPIALYSIPSAVSLSDLCRVTSLPGGRSLSICRTTKPPHNRFSLCCNPSVRHDLTSDHV